MLGLPAEIIIPLRVGYFADQLATTWPMVDSLGACVGLRVRSFHTQVKWSYAGGKTGLFVPDGLPLQPRRLYVCEGPTDTAVMWSIGGAALGRPLKDDRSPEVAEMTSILLSDYRRAGKASRLEPYGVCRVRRRIDRLLLGHSMTRWWTNNGCLTRCAASGRCVARPKSSARPCRLA